MLLLSRPLSPSCDHRLCLVVLRALCFVYRLSSNSLGMAGRRCGARRRRRRASRGWKGRVCACGGGGRVRAGRGRGSLIATTHVAWFNVKLVVVHYQYLIVGPNIVFWDTKMRRRTHDTQFHSRETRSGSPPTYVFDSSTLVCQVQQGVLRTVIYYLSLGDSCHSATQYGSTVVLLTALQTHSSIMFST